MELNSDYQSSPVQKEGLYLKFLGRVLWVTNQVIMGPLTIDTPSTAIQYICAYECTYAMEYVV